MPYDALLTCPRCAAPLGACEHRFDQGGIIDFVQGAARTALDDLDYDAHYSISVERSEREFAAVKDVLGDRLPSRVDRLLEIGCGTGGFSAGLLKGVNIGTAVLSDISPKMLQTCRKRLESASLLSRQETVFATYSGGERCFADEAFDCCCASFVVHHILDVGAFFKDVHRLLKPGGFAFFMEPNEKFHQALVGAASDVVAELIGRERDLESIAHFMNWIAEVRFNYVHSGDLEILAAREDKHMFSKDQMERLGREAGFGHVEVLPYGENDNGRSALSIYLSQLKVSEAIRAEAIELMKTLAPRHFAGLSPADSAPSSIIYLRKTALAPLRCDFRAEWSNGNVHITGWVLSHEPVRRLLVRIDGREFVTSVWLPRRDVFEAFAGDYPASQALSCGVETDFPSDANPSEIVISGLINGETIAIRTLN